MSATTTPHTHTHIASANKVSLTFGMSIDEQLDVASKVRTSSQTLLYDVFHTSTYAPAPSTSGLTTRRLTLTCSLRRRRRRSI